MSTDIENRLKKLEQELGELKDREAIREVIYRYCQAVDRCDLQMLKGCYHPDAYDDHGFHGGNAQDFSEFVIPLLEEVDSTIHAVTNTRIELDGNRASCASQVSVLHRVKHDSGFTDFWHNNRYLDVFEKRNNEWKILHRVTTQDMDRLIETIDIEAMIGDSPNRLLADCRGSEDPSYLGFDLVKHKPQRPSQSEFWGAFKAWAEAMRGVTPS
jgi:ketosteroid isomerase-like protein